MKFSHRRLASDDLQTNFTHLIPERMTSISCWRKWSWHLVQYDARRHLNIHAVFSAMIPMSYDHIMKSTKLLSIFTKYKEFSLAKLMCHKYFLVFCWKWRVMCFKYLPHILSKVKRLIVVKRSRTFAQGWRWDCKSLASFIFCWITYWSVWDLLKIICRPWMRLYTITYWLTRIHSSRGT